LEILKSTTLETQSLNSFHKRDIYCLFFFWRKKMVSSSLRSCIFFRFFPMHSTIQNLWSFGFYLKYFPNLCSYYYLLPLKSELQMFLHFNVRFQSVKVNLSNLKFYRLHIHRCELRQVKIFCIQCYQTCSQRHILF
jgi:hypothetical protein